MRYAFKFGGLKLLFGLGEAEFVLSNFMFCR